jgi:hypothetical protein
LLFVFTALATVCGLAFGIGFGLGRRAQPVFTGLLVVHSSEEGTSPEGPLDSDAGGQGEQGPDDAVSSPCSDVTGEYVSRLVSVTYTGKCRCCHGFDVLPGGDDGYRLARSPDARSGYDARPLDPRLSRAR